MFIKEQFITGICVIYVQQDESDGHIMSFHNAPNMMIMNIVFGNNLFFCFGIFRVLKALRVCLMSAYTTLDFLFFMKG